MKCFILYSSVGRKTTESNGPDSNSRAVTDVYSTNHLLRLMTEYVYLRFQGSDVLSFCQGFELGYEYNGQITELCGVQIARCVPEILGCVHHHDWLNMVHNMTRLAQFSQQV